MKQAIAIHDLPAWLDTEFVSDWMPLDQSLVSAFADVTDDHAWIHVDVPRATALRGGTIAHGLLVLALLPGIAATIVEVTDIAHALNYGFDKVRFTGLMPSGERLRLRLTFVEVSPRGEARLARMAFAFEREGSSKPVCVGEWKSLFYPETRPA